jgi:hypothetical protein
VTRTPAARSWHGERGTASPVSPAEDSSYRPLPSPRVTREPSFSRNPDIVFRVIEGGGVLLNIKSGAYHEVNSTASEIWEALETPLSESELLERMTERFGDVPDLDADIREFVGMLTDRDLIVPDQE